MSPPRSPIKRAVSELHLVDRTSRVLDLVSLLSRLDNASSMANQGFCGDGDDRERDCAQVASEVAALRLNYRVNMSDNTNGTLDTLRNMSSLPFQDNQGGSTTSMWLAPSSADDAVIMEWEGSGVFTSVVLENGGYLRYYIYRLNIELNVYMLAGNISSTSKITPNQNLHLAVSRMADVGGNAGSDATTTFALFVDGARQGVATSIPMVFGASAMAQSAPNTADYATSFSVGYATLSRRIKFNIGTHHPPDRTFVGFVQSIIVERVAAFVPTVAIVVVPKYVVLAVHTGHFYWHTQVTLVTGAASEQSLDLLRGRLEQTLATTAAVFLEHIRRPIHHKAVVLEHHFATSMSWSMALQSPDFLDKQRDRIANALLDSLLRGLGRPFARRSEISVRIAGMHPMNAAGDHLVYGYATSSNLNLEFDGMDQDLLTAIRDEFAAFAQNLTTFENFLRSQVLNQFVEIQNVTVVALEAPTVAVNLVALHEESPLDILADNLHQVLFNKLAESACDGGSVFLDCSSSAEFLQYDDIVVLPVPDGMQSGNFVSLQVQVSALDGPHATTMSNLVESLTNSVEAVESLLAQVLSVSKTFGWDVLYATAVPATPLSLLPTTMKSDANAKSAVSMAREKLRFLVPVFQDPYPVVVTTWSLNVRVTATHSTTIAIVIANQLGVVPDAVTVKIVSVAPGGFAKTFLKIEMNPRVTMMAAGAMPQASGISENMRLASLLDKLTSNMTQSTALVEGLRTAGLSNGSVIGSGSPAEWVGVYSDLVDRPSRVSATGLKLILPIDTSAREMFMMMLQGQLEGIRKAIAVFLQLSHAYAQHLTVQFMMPASSAIPGSHYYSTMSVEVEKHPSVLGLAIAEKIHGLGSKTGSQNASLEELHSLLEAEGVENVTEAFKSLQGDAITVTVAPRITTFVLNMPGTIRTFQLRQFRKGLASFLSLSVDTIILDLSPSNNTISSTVAVEIQVHVDSDAIVNAIRAKIEAVQKKSVLATSALLGAMMESGMNVNAFAHMATNITLSVADATVQRQVSKLALHSTIVQWARIDGTFLQIHNIDRASVGELVVHLSVGANARGFARQCAKKLLNSIHSVLSLTNENGDSVMSQATIVHVSTPIYGNSQAPLQLMQSPTISVVTAQMDISGTRSAFRIHEFIAGLAEFVGCSPRDIELSTRDNSVGASVLDLVSQIRDMHESAKAAAGESDVNAAVAGSFAEKGLFPKAWQYAKLAQEYALVAERKRSEAKRSMERARVIVASGLVESPRLSNMQISARAELASNAQAALEAEVSSVKPDIAAGEWARMAKEYEAEAFALYSKVLKIADEAASKGYTSSLGIVSVEVHARTSDPQAMENIWQGLHATRVMSAISNATERFANALLHAGFDSLVDVLRDPRAPSRWINVTSIERSNSSAPATNDLVQEALKDILKAECGSDSCTVDMSARNGTELEIDMETAGNLSDVQSALDAWKEDPEAMSVKLSEMTGLPLRTDAPFQEGKRNQTNSSQFDTEDIEGDAIKKFEQQVSWSPRLARAKVDLTLKEPRLPLNLLQGTVKMLVAADKTAHMLHEHLVSKMANIRQCNITSDKDACVASSLNFNILQKDIPREKSVFRQFSAHRAVSSEDGTNVAYVQMDGTASLANATTGRHVPVVSFVANASGSVDLGVHKNVFTNVSTSANNSGGSSSGGGGGSGSSGSSTDGFFTVEVWARPDTNGVLIDYRNPESAANEEVQTLPIVEQHNAQKIKIMHPNYGTSGTVLTQQTAKHTVTVDNGKHVQHILIVPGTDAAITSGSFAFSYTDPVTGTTSTSDCLPITNGGLNGQAWDPNGYNPPTSNGLNSAEFEIVDFLTNAAVGGGWIPANKLKSVKSVAYNGVGTSFVGNHGRFITLTLNEDTDFADIFMSTTDGAGNACATIPNSGFVRLNTNRQPGGGIPTLPHLPSAPADLGNPWVGSGAKFQMMFPFSGCTLCKKKADFTTADIKVEVIEPAGAPDLSTCPVNGFKCEVERAMQAAGFSANQITFAYGTNVALSSDGIKWEMTFSGDEVKGLIPAATISYQINAGDITIGSATNQHRITETAVPTAVVDGTTVPGQMGGFMIKSFDGASENEGSQLCLGWNAAMDGSAGDDHTLRGVLLDVGVTLAAVPSKSQADGGTEFVLKILNSAKPYQLRIHNVGCQPFQPVGNNGDGTDPLFVDIDSNSLGETSHVRTTPAYPSLAINEGRLAWILSQGDGTIVDTFFSNTKVPMNKWTHLVVSRERKDAPEVVKSRVSVRVKNASMSMMNISVGINGSATVTHLRSDSIMKLGTLTGLLPTISGGHPSSAKTIGATISHGGRGSGLVVDVMTSDATTLASIEVTAVGSGYKAGDVITFAAVGDGSTPGDYASFTYTLVAADFSANAEDVSISSGDVVTFATFAEPLLNKDWTVLRTLTPTSFEINLMEKNRTTAANGTLYFGNHATEVSVTTAIRTESVVREAMTNAPFITMYANGKSIGSYFDSTTEKGYNYAHSASHPVLGRRQDLPAIPMVAPEKETRNTTINETKMVNVSKTLSEYKVVTTVRMVNRTMPGQTIKTGAVSGTLPAITGGHAATGTTSEASISGGSGSGLVVDVKTLNGNATALESITVTTAGSGYEAGDVIIFSAVGDGSTAGDYASFNYTLVPGDLHNVTELTQVELNSTVLVNRTVSEVKAVTSSRIKVDFVDNSIRNSGDDGREDSRLDRDEALTLFQSLNVPFTGDIMAARVSDSSRYLKNASAFGPSLSAMTGSPQAAVSIFDESSLMSFELTTHGGDLASELDVDGDNEISEQEFLRGRDGDTHSEGTQNASTTAFPLKPSQLTVRVQNPHNETVTVQVPTNFTQAVISLTAESKNATDISNIESGLDSLKNTSVWMEDFEQAYETERLIEAEANNTAEFPLLEPFAGQIIEQPDYSEEKSEALHEIDVVMTMVLVNVNKSKVLADPYEIDAFDGELGSGRRSLFLGEDALAREEQTGETLPVLRRPSNFFSSVVNSYLRMNVLPTSCQSAIGLPGDVCTPDISIERLEWKKDITVEMRKNNTDVSGNQTKSSSGINGSNSNDGTHALNPADTTNATNGNITTNNITTLVNASRTVNHSVLVNATIVTLQIRVSISNETTASDAMGRIDVESTNPGSVQQTVSSMGSLDVPDDIFVREDDELSQNKDSNRPTKIGTTANATNSLQVMFTMDPRGVLDYVDIGKERLKRPLNQEIMPHIDQNDAVFKALQEKICAKAPEEAQKNLCTLAPEDIMARSVVNETCQGDSTKRTADCDNSVELEVASSNEWLAFNLNNTLKEWSEDEELFLRDLNLTQREMQIDNANVSVKRRRDLGYELDWSIRPFLPTRNDIPVFKNALRKIVTNACKDVGSCSVSFHENLGEQDKILAKSTTDDDGSKGSGGLSDDSDGNRNNGNDASTNAGQTINTGALTGVLPAITGGNAATGTTSEAAISGGSGTGLVVDVKTLSGDATALESITVTTAGSGYEAGDVITFAPVGNGSTAGDYASFNYTLAEGDFGIGEKKQYRHTLERQR